MKYHDNPERDADNFLKIQQEHKDNKKKRRDNITRVFLYFSLYIPKFIF